MDVVNQRLFSCSVLAVALATSSCGINQQSRFQTSFLPPAPHYEATAADIEPPPVEAKPNLYLKDLPAVLTGMPSVPPPSTRGDLLVQRAERRFEAGKKSYQAKDIPAARRDFDSAIDAMLEASDLNPADRQEYQAKLEEMVDAIHRFDLAGMGSAASLEQGKFEKAPLEDILQMTFPVDPKLKDRVKEQVAATVSQLPLSVTDAVLGYINYFSNRGRRTLLAGMQRSGRYRPMIQRILDEEGVPQELIHLAQAESGFIPRAVSRAAAGGMWQFLRWRGQEYGLAQSAFTDDRMDPEKATRAAARHLRDLYGEFGDWYLAIAAYNCGPGSVEKAVERTGYADFWELRSRGVLPAETTNYVPIILAMTIMEKNAAEYGIDHVTLDPPLEYDTVQVGGPTSLTLVSDITDTPATELAALNPGILKNTAPDGYSLHVPKGTGMQLAAALQLIPSEHRNAWRLHKVESGETLSAIGKRFGIPTSTIVAANHLDTREASEGERLVIPAALRVAPMVRTASRTAASRRTSTRTHSTRRATVVKPAKKRVIVAAR